MDGQIMQGITIPQLTGASSCGVTLLKPCSKSLQEKIAATIARYGDRERFLVTFNPDLQDKAGKNPERAFFGSAPSLVVLRKTYGDDFPALWIVPQLMAVLDYSNCKGLLSADQMRSLAYYIAQKYYYLKASELILFFYKFKLGEYGRFYGNADPMIITQALDKFLKDRLAAIKKHDEEEERRLRDEPCAVVTFEEYLQWKAAQDIANDAQCPEN